MGNQETSMTQFLLKFLLKKIQPNTLYSENCPVKCRNKDNDLLSQYFILIKDCIGGSKMTILVYVHFQVCFLFYIFKKKPHILHKSGTLASLIEHSVCKYACEQVYCNELC